MGDLSPLSFQTAKGVSENLAILNIKCSYFNNVILSGPAVVIRNLSQQVIVGMNF